MPKSSVTAKDASAASQAKERKVSKSVAQTPKRKKPQGSKSTKGKVTTKTKPSPKKTKAPPKKAKAIKVYKLNGKSERDIELPKVFDETLRVDLIGKAVNAARANRRVPYGPNPFSGKRHVAEWGGKGRGLSRVPRLDNNRGSFAPGTVGGRRAHPPRITRDWSKKVNRKERRKALRSALGATAREQLVALRGHKFDKKLSLPLVIDDKFASLKRTKDVLAALDKLGVHEDIVRAKNGVHIRAGRGKCRGRRYKVPKSLLIVVSEENGIERGARNILGVDVARVNELNVELLAPGGAPGRLTLFTESAFKEVSTWSNR